MNFVQIAWIMACSAAVALFIVGTRKWHRRWTSDFEAGQARKHHQGSPPRVGVLPLWAGMALGLAMLWESSAPDAAAGWALAMMSCSLPAVLLGLAEDLTKRVSPVLRLLGTVAAAALAMTVLGDRIERADLPMLDGVLAFIPPSVLLTMLVVCGFTHAMNLVDGLNGLACGLALVMLGGTTLVASHVQDHAVVQVCVMLACAVAGLWLVNFPRGLIFLGDGGAYFIGFMLVQIWLLMVHRHPELSPWLFVAVGAYPTTETLFSIYRRRFSGRRAKPAMRADRLHLHSLLYRRRAVPLARRWRWTAPWVPNAVTGLVLALAAAVPVGLAASAPSGTVWPLCVFAASAALYVLTFGRLLVRGPKPGPQRQPPSDASPKVAGVRLGVPRHTDP